MENSQKDAHKHFQRTQWFRDAVKPTQDKGQRPVPSDRVWVVPRKHLELDSQTFN